MHTPVTLGACHRQESKRTKRRSTGMTPSRLPSIESNGKTLKEPAEGGHDGMILYSAFGEPLLCKKYRSGV